MKNKIIIIATILLIGIFFPLAFLKIQPNSQNVDFNAFTAVKNSPNPHTQSSIPDEYSSKINMSTEYIYNVIGFGVTYPWYNFDKNSTDNWQDVWQQWATGPGGKVKVNFTGFYDRHVNDTWGFYNKFPNTNMPYMDIIITKPRGSVNLTRNNCSNGEIYYNMYLGHYVFDSGILIPKNLKYVKQLAIETATENNYILNIQEDFQFIQFNIKQTGIQSTELIYSRITGILIYAKINAFGTYYLEMLRGDYTLKPNVNTIEILTSLKIIYDFLKTNYELDDTQVLIVLLILFEQYNL